MPRPPKRPPNRADGRYERKYSCKELTGDSKRKSFYSYVSFEDCERQAKEYEAMLRAHRLVGDTYINKDAVFDDVAKIWLKHKEANVKYYTYLTTYKTHYDKYINPYFGKALINLLRPVDVQTFFDKHNKLSSSMRKKFLLILNGIFNLAIDNDLCLKNPARKITITEQTKIKKRVFTKKQKDIFTDECKKRGYYDFIILIETGMRRSELLGLHWEDVNYKNKYISVTEAITPNNKYTDEKDTKSEHSIRQIPISKSALDYIKKYAATGYVLTGNDKPMSPSGYAKNFKKRMDELCNECNIPGLTPHELRHTFGTLLREKGADIYTISKAMGHATIEITAKTYVKNDLKVLRKDMKINK